MSALGGNSQATADLIDALKSISRDIAEAGRQVRGGGVASLREAATPGNVGAFVGSAAGPVGAFVGEALGNNFITNTAIKATQDFGRDVAFGVAQDYAKYGTSFGSSFDQSVASNALRAGTAIPILGDIINEVQAPRESARARLKGLIDPALRGGAKIEDFDQESLKAQAIAFQQEDVRVIQGNKKIDALFDSKEVLGDAVAGSERFGELLDAAAAAGPALQVMGVQLGQVNALLGAYVSTLGALVGQAGYK